MKYSELAAINVNEHIEKKNNLSYLSWSWAVDTLLRHDENASWTYGEPTYFKDGTVMLHCSVNAFGRIRTAQLPVMDYKNKAISEPDAVQVNVTMQRVLAKAIALHGLGLYIYAGEDLPQEAEKPVERVVEKVVVDTKPVVAVDKDEDMEIMVPAISGEAEAIDWICSFVEELIPSMGSVDSLRQFWKVNKSVLSRVERFSKPKYATLEASFKAHAVKLKGEK